MNIQFGKSVAAAAAAGLMSMACAGSAQPPEAPDGAAADEAAGNEMADCCKGMNECEGKGGCKTGDNECKGMNECKGKGGCNDHCPS